jgi:hypothetical protein
MKQEVKKIKYIGIVFATGLFMLLQSCNKEQIDAELYEDMIMEESFAEEINNEIITLCEEGVDGTYFNNPLPPLQIQILSDCVSVRRDSNMDGVTVTLDFGTTGCVGRDGRVRKGRIIIEAQSMEIKAGNVRHISFSEYNVDGHRISGQITNTILSRQGQYQWEVEIVDSIVWEHASTGLTTTRKANLNRNFDFSRLGVLRDNSIISWGSVSLERNNNTLVRTVLQNQALVYRFPCRRIVQGVARLSLNGAGRWTINFGDGRCDNLAEIDNGRRIRTIRLR